MNGWNQLFKFVFYIQHGIISTNFQHDSVINSVDFFFPVEDFITMWMFNFLLHPLDSTKIYCTTLLSNSTRNPLCSNHVYIHILCFKFGQQLSQGSGAKLSPSFTFQPSFSPNGFFKGFILQSHLGKKMIPRKKIWTWDCELVLMIVNKFDC